MKLFYVSFYAEPILLSLAGIAPFDVILTFVRQKLLCKKAYIDSPVNFGCACFSMGGYRNTTSHLFVILFACQSKSTLVAVLEVNLITRKP